MRYGLEGKVALVTGGSRGIGLALARELLAQGAKVAVCARKPEGLEAARRELEAVTRKLEEAGGAAESEGDRGDRDPGDLMAVQAHIAEEDQVERLFEAVLDRFGRLDILVNNAGTGVNKLVIETEEQDWDLVMSVNAKGVFLCSRAVAREMIRLQTRGKIINISSQAGKTGALYQGAYCASKAAVLLFTQVLALELARFGINVNAVCPGVVDTPLLDALCEDLARRSKKSVEDVKKALLRRVPLGRMETPEDVAKVVLFLASEDAGYMTGQAINVTGGMERH
ncbi:MAG TPA: hypothetical protein DGR79_05325 [Clostridiales bacterium]|nr:hypothetical protein [Clostridiales bacterium]